MSKKLDYPVANIRHYLEPGPIVLVTSRWQDETDVMTLGWHTVMEFTPSLVGCIIASGNHSFELIRSSRECVINIPTVEMIDTVVDIGNCSGAEVDKFSRFGLTTSAASVRSFLSIARYHRASSVVQLQHHQHQASISCSMRCSSDERRRAVDGVMSIARLDDNAAALVTMRAASSLNTLTTCSSVSA